MGKLVAQNKWLFIGAALCVLISVVIDYLTPLLLAETLDYYLSGQPSTMPAFVNRWVDSWGGPNFMARNLWIVGLALVGLNIGETSGHGRAVPDRLFCRHALALPVHFRDSFPLRLSDIRTG